MCIIDLVNCRAAAGEILMGCMSATRDTPQLLRYGNTARLSRPFWREIAGDGRPVPSKTRHPATPTRSPDGMCLAQQHGIEARTLYQQIVATRHCRRLRYPDPQTYTIIQHEQVYTCTDLHMAMVYGHPTNTYINMVRGGPEIHLSGGSSSRASTHSSTRCDRGCDVAN